MSFPTRNFISQLKRLGRCLLKADNLGPAHRRKRWAWTFSPWLRIDLAVALENLSIKPSIDIRVLLGRVVVIDAVLVFVPIHPIEWLIVAIVLITINRIAIERISDRLALAHHRLEVDRCDVIVIVVGSSAVPTPLVQLSCEKRIGAPVVLDRIEDRYSIDRQSDRATKKVILGRHRLFRRLRMQRNTPRVASCVSLRQGDLLLPSRDADHHGMIGNPIGFHIEEVVVPTQP